MVHVKDFAVEQWMDLYENTPGVLNVAETCCASVSIDDLRQLATDDSTEYPLKTKTKLTYGAIRGSQVLRERIATLCSRDGEDKLGPDDVLITPGAIHANFLLLYTLIGPGDHVVCVYPTYQQLYTVPESLGAEVSLWHLQPNKGWLPDVAELEGLLRDNTKMVIVNNPNNPSGAPIPGERMQAIADLAKSRSILLFSDEVYRPLFHEGVVDNPDVAPPVVSLGYENTVVTGSMSKAWALAGIRIGWVASKNKAIIDAVASARDYTTISVSQLDDQVASYALSPSVQGALLDRNIALARTNVEMLARFVDEHAAACSWVRPKAGTTAFVQFRNEHGDPVNDVDFCIDLLNRTKVFFVPGSRCFGGGEHFKGYVRIGYVCETEVLRDALDKLSGYTEEHLA